MDRRLTARLIATIALLAVGCRATPAPDPQPAPPPDDGITQPADDGGSVTVYGCPTRTLLPQDNRDLCGARIITQLFSGLVELDPASGTPRLLVASSIETDDAMHWTIELERGWSFHDGEAVTAQSFIDAWNFAAHPDNDLRNAEFFSDITGFDAVQAGQAATLAGLERIDKHTFAVHLDQPFAPFLSKLSDPAFFPLPSIAYEDLAIYGRQPIGNGRYELREYDPERHAILQRHEAWTGADPGMPERVTFLLYSGEAAVETAYQDVLAGALDVLDDVPPSRLDDVEDDFGPRVVRTPTSALTSLGFPLYNETFGSRPQLRRAFSLALDREAIVNEVFAGSQQPADALIPPVLDAHRSGACDACRFDPEEARTLLADAGGWQGPLVVHYNSGGGHDAWMRAIADQWRTTLGIDEVIYQAREFPAYINQLEDRAMHGPFRVAWALSYPSPEYALAEPFRQEGAANYTGYGNPSFDEALDRAVASTPDASVAAYQQAEDLVLDDLPVIPLWFSTSTSVHSSRVDDIVVDATSVLRVDRLRVTTTP